MKCTKRLSLFPQASSLKPQACFFFLLLILHSSLFTLHSSAQGVITTVAGSGWIFRGDGGRATNAPLGYVRGVAIDSAGNLFIVDGGNHLVFKVSPIGILTVVAGNGIRGFSGDGGPARSASLHGPRGLALDATGNVYIADTYNNRVRKISPDGIITTVAGSGFGYSGDGGPAINASFRFPSDVAVDLVGNLYIADTENSCIRKVNPAGTITTFAGTGRAGFSGDGGVATMALLQQPQGVAVNASSSVYIADTGNNRIRKVTTSGIVTTVAGDGFKDATGRGRFSGDGGPAVGASLDEPYGLAVDSSASLYIADRVNHRIRKVSFGGIISTVAGNGFSEPLGDGGPAGGAALYGPEGVALDSASSLYIADTTNWRVRKVNSAGIITSVAGNGVFKFSGDNGPATSASLSEPFAVAVDSPGNLYVADTSSWRVRRIGTDGIITTVAGNGQRSFSGDGGLGTSASISVAFALAIDRFGNLFIADRDNSRIRRLSPAGILTTVAGCCRAGYSGDGGPATSAALSFPLGVAVDPGGCPTRS